jgi:hypothetical protein
LVVADCWLLIKTRRNPRLFRSIIYSIFDRKYNSKDELLAQEVLIPSLVPWIFNFSLNFFEISIFLINYFQKKQISDIASAYTKRLPTPWSTSQPVLFDTLLRIDLIKAQNIQNGQEFSLFNVFMYSKKRENRSEKIMSKNHGRRPANFRAQFAFI